jgi:4-hydroxybenzoate polyprenyltransferase
VNLPAIAKFAFSIIELTRLNRPIGIYLLLWPTLWSLWFAAGGFPDLKLLIIFIVGTVLTRSAGCAMNDYADRDFDGHVQRTRNRPIPSGSISPRTALLVAALLMLAAFALVLQTNALTVKLSFVALILAVVYPFTKRFTYFPQLFLGAAFAWAIPMAFAAQSGELTRITWLAFLAAVLWAMAYDTIYAMVDRQDDLKVGIRSTAILFGEADVAIVGILHLLVLLAQLLIGFALQRGVWYFCALLVAGLLVIYQLWLIRKREPASCFRAFLNNNYLGIVLLSGTIMDYAMNPASTAAN